VSGPPRVLLINHGDKAVVVEHFRFRGAGLWPFKRRATTTEVQPFEHASFDYRGFPLTLQTKTPSQ
jgi:hypothetical protein